jgi:hypothetical protein
MSCNLRLTYGENEDMRSRMFKFLPASSKGLLFFFVVVAVVVVLVVLVLVRIAIIQIKAF